MSTALRIDKDGEYVTISALQAALDAQCDAERTLLAAEHALAATKARIDQQIRLEAITTQAKLTENAITSRVTMHDDVTAAEMEVMEAQYQAAIARGNVEVARERCKIDRLQLQFRIALENSNGEE